MALIEQCEAAADPGPRRAAVQLTFGEDARVAAVRLARRGRPREDRAVQEGQVGIAVGVVQRHGLRDGLRDAPARIDKPVRRRRFERDADLAGVDVGVEGPAKGDIDRHLTEPRYLHWHVAGDHERRDVAECHGHAIAVAHCGRHDSPRGGVDPHRAAGFDEPGLDSCGGEGDDPMAAHGAETGVVEEEDTHVAVGGHRLGHDTPVHVRMAAGLPHEHSPQTVQVLGGVAPLGEHRAAGRVGKALDDDTQRLAGGVGIHRPEANPS